MPAADKPIVTSLAASMAAGRTTSRALVEEALARIADPGGEGRRCFVRVYADSARKAADAQDQLRAAGYVVSPLAGLPVSIKDLFDVAGERTLAGSKALDDRPPAARDAAIVTRLRAAGAVLIGRTNMTEFAFSGVGINPHYGTPGNPFDRQRIPGGSSSGAPISVMDGFAVVAIAAQRLGVPRTLVLDDLEPAVATAFERACAVLSRAGARLVELPLAELGDYGAINAKGGFSPPEAYAWHAPLIDRRGAEYDPRVRLRIERGRAMSAAEYVTLSQQRGEFIAAIDARTAEFDALLMPTVPITAPPIAAFDKDEDYWRLNGRLLRNTAIVNFLDRCAVTLPIHRPSTVPVGLMIVGRHSDDRRLLGMALALEAAIEDERWS